MRSPFLYPEDADYKRDFAIFGRYIKDAAFLLHKQTGYDLDYCTDWVRKSINKGGKHEAKNPKAFILNSENNGNRKRQVTTVTEYIANIVKNNKIVAPSMTVYSHPKQKKSLLAEFILHKLDMRKKAKKEMFLAEKQMNEANRLVKEATANNDQTMASQQAIVAATMSTEKAYFNCLQTSAKIAANSLSGTFGFAGTVLFNKTAHSSLTSICRCAASNANANNERFLSGNRHYWSLEVTLNNIVNILTTVDCNRVREVVERYGLVYPTVEQVVEAVRGCTDYYWSKSSPALFQKVVDFIHTLTPEERAGYLYNQDAYHVMKCNDHFFRVLVKKMITIPDELPDDPDHWMKLMDEDILMFASRLCSPFMSGKSVKDLENAYKEGKNKDYLRFVAVVKNVLVNLQDYADFIQTFWATSNPPMSLAMIPTMMRRCAVLSDTDSTIFTTQDWTTWYQGKLDFTYESESVSALMVYFTSCMTTHLLAMHSAQMGVDREQLYTLAMKSEFANPLLGLTTRGKHYYSYVSAKEGNVYSEYVLDIKGVGLRNSKLPPNIRESSDNFIRHVMDTIMKGEKLSVHEVLTRVADEEREIIRSIHAGEPTYLSVAKINTADAYKQKELNSTYQLYGLWEQVFAPKYGHAPLPPFDCVAVNIDANNKSDMAAWLDNSGDEQFAQRFRNWLAATGKDKITRILLPTEILRVHGLPKEIINALDLRKVLMNLMDAHYLILESLGVFIRNQRISHLVSDTY